MADEGYLFSKDLTQRTVNTIKKVSGTVTRASVPPARSRRGGGSKGVSLSVSPAIITSGDAGIYVGDIISTSGEIIEKGVDIIASLATTQTLSSGTYVVATKILIETMG